MIIGRSCYVKLLSGWTIDQAWGTRIQSQGSVKAMGKQQVGQDGYVDSLILFRHLDILEALCSI